MLAASWGLRAPNLATARANALRNGIPAHLVDQAMDLLRHDREYVASEVSRIVSGARMPAPAGRPPLDEDEDDEDLDDEHDDDEKAAP
jgi:hypothetical protein